MAVITPTAMTGSGSRTVTETTLGASDTLAFSKGAILVLRNATAGALTPNIDGDGGTTVPVQGVGNVDVTGGYTTPSIAAGAVAAIPLNTIEQYCKGTVTVTGGTGIVATLLV